MNRGKEMIYLAIFDIFVVDCSCTCWAWTNIMGGILVLLGVANLR